MHFQKKYANIYLELAQIAQLVEQRTENPRVTGSIPVLGIYRKIKTKKIKKVVDKQIIMIYNMFCCEAKVKNTCGCSSMVEHQPSKLDTWVRFPSPAFN